MKTNHVLAAIAVLLCFTACNNDSLDALKKQHMPVERKLIENLDVSNYGKWTYINLNTGAYKQYDDYSEWIYTDGATVPAKPQPEVDFDWHIAVHRYEIKTNGGEVLDTQITDMNAVSSLPAGNYTKDESITHEDKEFPIITDMSKMMQENVGYAHMATINRTLCHWVTKKKTGSMPPVIYTPNNHVYILKNKDGSWSKLQFTSAGNTETNKSGYITFSYEHYPRK